jgi:hypothetical protein
MSESPPPPDEIPDAATLQADLAAARETIRALERRQKIDAALADSDPIDTEVARLLTEAAVAGMDEPDVKLAIEDLRRQKPYLFRRREAGPAAMPARTPRPPQSLTADAAAKRAIETGFLARDLPGQVPTVLAEIEQ